MSCQYCNRFRQEQAKRYASKTGGLEVVLSHGSDYPSREFLVQGVREEAHARSDSGHTFAASASSLSAAAVGAGASRVSAAALHFDM